MPRIAFADGTSRDLPDGEPLGSIVPVGAIAARFEGELVDLSFVPDAHGRAEVVQPDDLEGLRILRHSSAHVLAHAVCDLWPGARYAIGPPVEDGFYYDVELPVPIGESDLAKIEDRMRELVQADQPFVRQQVSREDALRLFEDQPYKREIIESLDESEGARGDTVTVYRNDGWPDLCLGPHVPSTGALTAFKLMKLAGAYWRGDETRPMLQRIYGTAWPSQGELDAYLVRLEEAEKRDHRRLGRELDLFSFPEELGPGLAVWHPKGGLFRKQLEDYVRDLHLERGYDLVQTPHLARRVLWDTSGHTAKYVDNMYPEMVRDEAAYFVKPMNCPFHVLIFQSQSRSYRELPMRLSELGTVYRYERAGTLHGLLRARGLTQDDSHVICTEDQLVDEILAVFDLTLEIHRTFGFVDPVVTLSTKPGLAIGDEAMWSKAIEALTNALERSGLTYEVAEGEGAFYGPKVDFHFRDAIGRLWQLTTVQCDFALPERFDMEYVGHDNEWHRPVMIHRAILGSLERFSGVLIEHYAGAFPLWLSPVQVRLVPVADRHVEHARSLADRLRAAGLRPEIDRSGETVGKKVRAAQLQKTPYVLVIGDKEIASGAVTVRTRDGTETRGVAFEAFADALVREARERRLTQSRFGD
ncbi:MAG TPA: threonine--tRNA ligase [Actinomycetota bacterium]|nr:threonine--tRNA ligase [Actinomycetota bacterium]